MTLAGFILVPVAQMATDSSLDTVSTFARPTGDCDVLAVMARGKAINYTVTTAAAANNPSASFGIRIPVNGSDLIHVADGWQVRIIQEDATATVDYQWFKLVKAV